MNIKSWFRLPWRKRIDADRYASFRYEAGHVAGRTLTVAGLRDMLNGYHDDTPVFVQWEGVFAYVDEANFERRFVHKGNPRDERYCVVIDVNEY